jgi:hypothetical protein
MPGPGADFYWIPVEKTGIGWRVKEVKSLEGSSD